MPFQIFVILNSSCTLPYLKGEKIGRQSGPYLQVGSKNPRSWQPQTCIYFMLHAYNCLLDSTQTAVSRILQKNCVNCPQFKNNMVGFIYTFCFWSWVLERSLERKKSGSPDIKILLDFAIFSILSKKLIILSYQCDIIL